MAFDGAAAKAYLKDHPEEGVISSELRADLRAYAELARAFGRRMRALQTNLEELAVPS